MARHGGEVDRLILVVGGNISSRQLRVDRNDLAYPFHIAGLSGVTDLVYSVGSGFRHFTLSTSCFMASY